MAINFVRGFRRIGWVITFPLAAFIVLVFFENTREFSPFDYEVIQANPPTLPAYFFEALEQQIKPPPGTVLMSPPGSDYLVELSGIGTAWFSGEVPKGVVERVLQDFEAKHKPPAAEEPQKPSPAKIPDTLPADFFSKQQTPKAAVGPWTKYQKSPTVEYLGPLPEKLAQNPAPWTFTVHKRINKLKLAGLIAGSLVVPALIIQGSISILAWIFRGFKG